MAKKELKPSSHFIPTPAALISSGEEGKNANVMTAAWTGIACSEPPYVSVAIRPGRHSSGLIKSSGEFVLNLPHEALLRETDWCGVVSGRDVDKFKKAGLRARKGSRVKAPLVDNCPLNLECRVKEVVSLGVHDLFIGEVLAVHVEEEFLEKGNRLDPKKLKPLVYWPPNREYWSFGERLAPWGFSAKEGVEPGEDAE